jgi:hypothetical protein
LPVVCFGFKAMLPYIAVLGVSVVARFIVQGNFSNLTSGVLAVRSEAGVAASSISLVRSPMTTTAMPPTLAT